MPNVLLMKEYIRKYPGDVIEFISSKCNPPLDFYYSKVYNPKFLSPSDGIKIEVIEIPGMELKYAIRAYKTKKKLACISYADGTFKIPVEEYDKIVEQIKKLVLSDEVAKLVKSINLWEHLEDVLKIDRLYACPGYGELRLSWLHKPECGKFSGMSITVPLNEFMALFERDENAALKELEKYVNKVKYFNKTLSPLMKLNKI